MAVTSQYTFWDDPATKSWFTVRLNYTVTRSGSNVTMKATPIIFVAGTGAGWYNNRILVDVSIGGSYTEDQVVKPTTSGGIVGKTYTGKEVSRTYANTTDSIPVIIKVHDHVNANFGVWTKSITVPAPAAIPSAPGVTISGITVSSFVVSWTASMSATKVSYQINGGAWVYPSGSGVSGSFTVSGLGAGTTNSINVAVQGPGGWSSNTNKSVATLHQSTLTSRSASPLFGSSTTLTLSWASTQTGGSTTVDYRIGTGSWIRLTGSSYNITGLSAGTSYTISMRAVNSSGVVVEYSVSATTHTPPSGSFTLSQANKSKVTATLGATSNTTTTSYSFNSGTYTTFSNTATFTGLTPGTTHSVAIRLYSSTTGLTTNLSAKSITLSSFIRATSLTQSSRTRSSSDMVFVFSEATTSYKWGLASASNEVGITSSTTVYRAITGLKTGSSYTLYVQPWDVSYGGYAPVQTVTFTTASFTPPTVTISNHLTYITVTYKIVDSCSAAGNHENASWSTEVLASGATTSFKFTKSTSGELFAANTSYTLNAYFQDEHRASSTAKITVSATGTTVMVPTITSYTATPSNITSLSSSFPALSLSLSSASYEKTVKFSMGSVLSTIATGTAAVSRTLTQAELLALIDNNPTLTSLDITAEVSFKEDGRTSPTKSTGKIQLNLTGSIIDVKVPTSIAYTASNGLALSALVSQSINAAKITVPKQGTPRGSSIAKQVIKFQSREIPLLAEGGVVTVDNVSTFSSGTSFMIEITDARGLKNSKTFSVNTYEYSPPTVTIGDIARDAGGFGTSLEANNITVTWSSPPTTSTKNSVSSVLLQVRHVGGQYYQYGTIVPAANLTTTTTGTIIKTFEVIGVPGKTITGLGTTFLTSRPYQLKISAKDVFEKEAIIDNIPLPSGQPTLFIDTKNKQVAVNTTTPRGSFEVDGEGFFHSSHSLNQVVFDPSEVQNK